MRARGGRLPDFIVIGTMKSATTTLFRWLGQHPETSMPEVKEPRFFSDDDRWQRGVEWYASLFPTGGGTTGEASVAYTAARSCERSAARIADVVPQAKLVCVLRRPAERARSHYLHQVRRGREQRPWTEVLHADSPYVTDSCYHRVLRPYLGALAPRLLVITTEDLSSEEATGWHAVLRHLGLADMACPAAAHNVGAASPSYTPLMRILHDRGLTRHLERFPAPLRRVGRNLAVRADAPEGLRSSASAPPPSDVLALWQEEADRLADALGWASSPWDDGS